MNLGNVIFHDDNAGPYVTQHEQRQLPEFGWEILSHPSCSLDIASSVLYLFRSLRYLAGKKFENVNAIENTLQKYFDKKPKKLYTN